ncbi:MAG: hypothetical protein HRU19_32235 [Pseudobacteriovorax sp.]|nr:hypothetical protein [Pseudobacteriovorax sp.]
MRQSTLLKTISTACLTIFTVSCGNDYQTQSSLKGLASEDAAVAAIANQYRSQKKLSHASQLKPGKTWSCILFNAIENVSVNTVYTRKFTSIAGILTVENTFKRDRGRRDVITTGAIVKEGHRYIGSQQGETDLWVVPYDPIEFDIRISASGDLIDEWVIDPDAFIFDVKNGLSNAALRADTWMESSRTQSGKVVLGYSVCEQQD